MAFNYYYEPKTLTPPHRHTPRPSSQLDASPLPHCEEPVAEVRAEDGITLRLHNQARPLPEVLLDKLTELDLSVAEANPSHFAYKNDQGSAMPTQSKAADPVRALGGYLTVGGNEPMPPSPPAR